MLKISSSLLLASLAASGAIAQSNPVGSYGSFGSFPPGMYLDSELSYNYLFNGEGDSQQVGYFDLTLGMGPVPGSSAPIGAEIYLRSFFEVDGGGDDLTNYGGILYYESNYGRFSIGNPHGVVGDYISGPRFGTFLDSSEFGLFSNGYADIYLQQTEGKNWGVRYDGEFGNFRVGAAYHELLDGGGTDYLYAVAANYRYNNYEFGLAMESGEGASQPGYFVSAKADYNKLTAGVLVGQRIESNDLYYSIFADYQVIPDLTVSMAYVGFSNSGNSLTRVSTEYTFFENAFVGAGYTGVSSSDPIYELNAGYRLSF